MGSGKKGAVGHHGEYFGELPEAYPSVAGDNYLQITGISSG
ncbi:MAG: hypothetical protein QNJ46_33910 [Leptolyngbyaceae cyanobacterium MO_188.B28]|nr:hypothetical protein [Leptolyngbyaceae cyanobacterium MO_188.B28]